MFTDVRYYLNTGTTPISTLGYVVTDDKKKKKYDVGTCDE